MTTVEESKNCTQLIPLQSTRQEPRINHEQWIIPLLWLDACGIWDSIVQHVTNLAKVVLKVCREGLENLRLTPLQNIEGMCLENVAG
jgi:hypothetical protein